MKLTQVQIGRIVASLESLRSDVFRSGCVDSPAIIESAEVLNFLGVRAGRDVFEQDEVDIEASK